MEPKRFLSGFLCGQRTKLFAETIHAAGDCGSGSLSPSRRFFIETANRSQLCQRATTYKPNGAQ